MLIKELSYGGKTYYNLTKDAAKSFGIPDNEYQTALDNEMLNNVLENRRQAYLLESDPLYMEWQFDKLPESEQVWRDKVAEIKARYPLPSES